MTAAAFEPDVYFGGACFYAVRDNIWLLSSGWLARRNRLRALEMRAACCVSLNDYPIIAVDELRVNWVEGAMRCGCFRLMVGSCVLFCSCLV